MCAFQVYFPFRGRCSVTYIYTVLGASDEGPYFYFDGEKQEFVKYNLGAAGAGAGAGAEAEQEAPADGRGEGEEDDAEQKRGADGNEDHDDEDPEI